MAAEPLTAEELATLRHALAQPSIDTEHLEPIVSRLLATLDEALAAERARLLREALPLVTARVIHRWRHPSFRFDVHSPTQSCGCLAEAAMAVDVYDPALAAQPTTGDPKDRAADRDPEEHPESRDALWAKWTGAEKLAYGCGYRDGRSEEIDRQQSDATAAALDVERLADLFMDLRLDGPAAEGWTYQQTARHYAAIIAREYAAHPETEEPTDGR